MDFTSRVHSGIRGREFRRGKSCRVSLLCGETPGYSTANALNRERLFFLFTEQKRDRVSRVNRWGEFASFLRMMSPMKSLPHGLLIGLVLMCLFVQEPVNGESSVSSMQLKY